MRVAHDMHCGPLLRSGLCRLTAPFCLSLTVICLTSLCVVLLTVTAWATFCFRAALVVNLPRALVALRLYTNVGPPFLCRHRVMRAAQGLFR